jgi:hypothetical protein
MSDGNDYNNSSTISNNVNDESNTNEVSLKAGSEELSSGNNSVAEIIDKAKRGVSMLEQLLDDMEDEEFWTLPAGEWEKKNNRDENGLPL